MISRVADHCFWLGRYLERAETTARLIEQSHLFALDTELRPSQIWWPILVVCGEASRYVAVSGGPTDWKLEEGSPPPITIDEGEARNFLTWHSANGMSVVASVRAMRENASAIRDVLSADVWEAINGLYLRIGDLARARDLDATRAICERVRTGTQLALGMMRSTMLHDAALDFIWLGLMLERASQTARVLDVHHHALSYQDSSTATESAAMESALWLLALHVCAGREAYLRAAVGAISGRGVLTFLLTEPRFPRSVHYCLEAARARLIAATPHEQVGAAKSRSRAHTRLTALVDFVANSSNHTVEPELIHELLTHVVDETAHVCDELALELFGAGAG